MADENITNTGRVCPNCGAPLAEDAVFCENCGAAIPAAAGAAAAPASESSGDGWTDSGAGQTSGADQTPGAGQTSGADQTPGAGQTFDAGQTSGTGQTFESGQTSGAGQTYGAPQSGWTAGGSGPDGFNTIPDTAMAGGAAVAAPKKKKKTGLIIAIIIIVLAAIGVGLYFGLNRGSTVDLFDGMSDPEYEGYNGYGSVYTEPTNSSLASNESDSDKKAFYESIYYTVDPQDNLSNGDEVTVTAHYSKSEAESLNINIKDDSTTIKVKGLPERYENADAIDDADWKAIVAKAEEVAVDDSFFTDLSVESVKGVYFLSNQTVDDYNLEYEYVEDEIIVVMQVKSESYGSYYIAYYLDEVNTNMDFQNLSSDDFHYGVETMGVTSDDLAEVQPDQIVYNASDYNIETVDASKYQ